MKGLYVETLKRISESGKYIDFLYQKKCVMIGEKY